MARISKVPRLSKSRFQAGLQCAKHLWLHCYAYDQADPLSASQEALFAQGHEVGALGREYFPGGVLVEEDHLHSFEAMRTTRNLIDEGFSCLYEAAFGHEGVVVRSDIIVQEGAGTWALVEVKSSTDVKDEHITDLGIQAYVLRGAGLAVGRSYVLHINNEYVWQGGPYDLGQLFTLTDVTARVEQFLPAIPGLLSEMKAALAGPCPEISVGRHCGQPYRCRFYGYCHDPLPEFPVTEIPRISAKALEQLTAAGYLSICDIPHDYPALTERQRRVCRAIWMGKALYEPGLASALDLLKEPVHFLDFETYQSALPVWVGTRPYQALPVQWSLHTLAGRLQHQEFLHTERSDPRPALAEALLSALRGEGRIVVYSGYENGALEKLADELPQFAEGLTELRARLFDLERVVARYVQHPAFHGHTSLKYVLPALVPDLSYAGLAVPDGQVATLRYGQAVFGECSPEERQAIFADLLAYCRTDTLGLVRIYQELLKAAETA